jgi:diguanylate cyclase (GGDEF)-like protein
VRPKDPNKTKKLKTVPLPIPDESNPVSPHAASPTAQPPALGSQNRVSAFGPPSSDGWAIEEQVVTERNTEPTLTVPAGDKTETAMLTVITGFNAGQVFMLDGTHLIIGRGNDTTVPVEDAGVSRAHARISKEGNDWFVEDMGSTNGTFVAATPVRGRTLLARGDRIQLGPSLMLRFDITDRQEAELQHRLYESSTRDALTRAYNRKYLMERLTAEVAHSRRHRVKMSVLILDLDRFKVLNDTYGHLAGDAVLRAVSQTVQKLIRVEDLLARYGGEEFVILARSTGRTDATRLAERIRKTVEELEVPTGQHVVKCTVSIGLAPLSDVGEHGGPNEILSLADERLYRAKNSGRNRVIAADAG